MTLRIAASHAAHGDIANFLKNYSADLDCNKSDNGHGEILDLLNKPLTCWLTMVISWNSCKNMAQTAIKVTTLTCFIFSILRINIAKMYVGHDVLTFNSLSCNLNSFYEQ